MFDNWNKFIKEVLENKGRGKGQSEKPKGQNPAADENKKEVLQK